MGVYSDLMASKNFKMAEMKEELNFRSIISNTSKGGMVYIDGEEVGTVKEIKMESIEDER